jgi:hypothetical protein
VPEDSLPSGVRSLIEIRDGLGCLEESEDGILASTPYGWLIVEQPASCALAVIADTSSIHCAVPSMFVMWVSKGYGEWQARESLEESLVDVVRSDERVLYIPNAVLCCGLARSVRLAFVHQKVPNP